MKKLSIALIASMLCSLFFAFASIASPDYPDAREVFPQEEVDKLMLKVEEKVASELSVKTRNNAALKASGTYPRKKGDILVTSDAWKGLIPTGHAAIVYNPKKVVEALINGVVLGENNWYQTKSKCYGVVVNGTSAAQRARVADWCYRQLHKPYNLNYSDVNTRSRFYCSQLIWAGYKDNYGIDLNTSSFGAAIHPMELVTSNKTHLIYTK